MADTRQEEYKKGGDDIVSTFKRFILEATELTEPLPKYEADTRKRDCSLRRIARTENMLSGVLSTVVARNANRSFSLVGGARQVSKYSNILHDLNGGEGWHDFVTKLSTAYYSTNFGYGAEIAFDNELPASMYSFDSTRTKLLGVGGDTDGNLIYQYPKKGNINKYKRGEFIHDNSMPAIEFDLKNAGMCAIERCLTASQTIAGVMQYYLDKVSVAPSQGIVHFKGIELDEFKRAVELAEEEQRSSNATIYKGTMSLFTRETTSDISLVSFSDLPDNFTYETFIDVIMQVYALAFNYPVGQFWSIASGSFGRTGEMEVQEQMATEKGELEFAISLQGQLHKWFLPPTVTFKFDIRNDSGDLVREAVRTERIAQATEMVGSGIITAEQARTYLAQHGDIPQEWAETLGNDVENELSIVREDFRKSAMENSAMMSRMIKSGDPIISYTWNPEAKFYPVNLFEDKNIRRSTIEGIYKYEYPRGAINVLYQDLDDATRKKVF